ncbi:MAG: signal recognition particle protein [Candidatus Gastranaerophilales bacterium]|nr:signal recognition particle protein [Candidatus Gastranaerophilales bacterium]
MFENLSERLQDIIKTTSGKKLTQDNMDEALREIRRAFLEADVSLGVVKSFISKIKDKAEGEKILDGVNPSQQLIKIVNDEIIELLGGQNTPLSTEGEPNLIMLLGLQGSGKTTSAAKLALSLRKQNRKPLLVAADVYRPAAIKQLVTLAGQIGVDVFYKEDNQDVKDIVKQAIDHAKGNGHNSVIIDTAGRLQIDTDMMAELLLIDRMFKPQEKLLVVDAMVGQEAVNVAQNFNEQLGLSGVILTKLDGDARGGAALSVVYSTGKPIKFTGMGEKIEALEPFYPERMAQRILGMGDIVSLVEKAQTAIDEKEALELQKKMMSKDFSLEDFIKVQKQIKMLGSFDQILGMLPIPGLGKKDKETLAHEGEAQLKRIEALVNSMTPYERKNPDVLNANRKRRVASGCGLTVQDINKFLNDFEMMKKMMKQLSGMQKMMRGKGSKGGKMPRGFGMPGGFNPAMMGKFGKFR